jgi:Flp pilus assembly pilin Flp
MPLICRLFRLRSRYTKNTSGAVTVEYAMLIAIIAIVAATGMTALGGNLEGFLNTVGGGLQVAF